MIRLALPLAAIVVSIAAPALAAPQEINAYTRYELLAPGSGKFRIIYDVTAARPGATAYFNPIRKGSIATDERVVDMATGKPLEFKVVDGAAARATGLPEASLDSDYIRVTLARPVPADGGQGRVRIDKTYEDAKSYFQDGRDIIFDRPLGVKRNAVVLPSGYQLVSSNYPSQVAQEADGRLRISFINNTPAQAPLKLRARPGNMAPTANSAAAKAPERAAQTRDIVYFLNAPETHSFALYHDYTEDRPGVGQYVNVVRTGSTASEPSARNMDTGELLKAQQLKGAAITAAGIKDPGLREVTPETEIVLFTFPPVKQGESVRLRLAETYTDPGRYKLVGDELVFDRALGRPANAVVLPAGWTLTNSAAPVVVSQTEDGRTRLDFINPALGDLSVLITAKRK